MSRYIQSLDIEAPDIPLLKTLEMDFTYQAGQPYGGLSTEMFPLDAFPWLWRAYMQADAIADPSVGTHVFQLQGRHNGTNTVVVKPAEIGSQLIINREAQYYVRRFEQGIAGNQIPELVYLDTDNSLAFRSMRTPTAFEDKALGNLDAYEVISFNATTREIRFKGISYDRKQASDGGEYGIGKYKGAAKFLRDILDDDQEQLDLSWKFKTHAYGHARLISSNRRVTYDRLRDDNARDPVAGSTLDTYHTMRIQESLTPAERPVAGDRLQLFRRQTHVAGSLTTAHTWSQKYWMLETEIELAQSFYQFFAIFGWTMYQETTDGISWNTSDLTKRLKNGEIDFFENPCGDVRWRYHNAHAPYGGQFNMAALQSRTPVMPARTPEWDQERMQQHQLAENVGTPYTERTTLRQYWYPPGNAANKPGNSLEWYMRVPDGRFMRIGGCLAPDFWANGQLDDKQIFFNAAVGGDFLRGLNYEYGGGASNSPKVEDFISKVYSFKAYQFPGQMAGGAGATGQDGTWPEGKQPTPGDISGNSGSGIVGDDGGTGDGGPVTPFSTSVDIIATAGKIAVPKVGKSYPLSARVIRNTEGFSAGFDYVTKTVDGYEVSVEKLTEDGTQAEFTFTAIGSTPPVDGLVLSDIITVQATETGGPGTSPIINGSAITLDSDVNVPDDPIEDPDPFNGTISVIIRGPKVSGQTTGMAQGTRLSIQMSSSQLFYTEVLDSGIFQFANFGTSFHGRAMTVNYPGPPVLRSSSFFYDNPVVSSGVWVLRYEVQAVGPGSVTLYLGLSTNRPATVRYGFSPSTMFNSQLISSTNDNGDDSNSPHIYKLTGLTSGRLYYLQVYDHIDESYTTTVVSGTPLNSAPGLTLIQPQPGFVAGSPDVFFEWSDATNANAVYELLVYSNAARTQLVVGTNSVPFDTENIGTATSHTFTNDPSNGTTRFGILNQWADNTYNANTLEILLFEYTAYENVVDPGSYSTPTFNVPGGELGQYATVTWVDPVPDPNARLNLYVDSVDDGDSKLASESTSWTVQRSLTPGPHTFELWRSFDGYATHDVPTSMQVTIASPVVVEGNIFVKPNGNDANNGSTEALAFRTLQKGIDAAYAGGIVNVKAGVYASLRDAGRTVRSGTSSSPIWIRGYTNTPGDNPTQAKTVTSSDAFDSAKFPCFSNTDRTSTTYIGLNVGHQYIKVSGLQFRDYTYNIRNNGQSNNTYSWVYSLRHGDIDQPEYYFGNGFNVSGSNNTFSDCYDINGSGEGFSCSGSNNNYNRCKVYVNTVYETASDNHKGVDYYFNVAGTDDTYTDCHAMMTGAMNVYHGGHGFNIRGTRCKFYRPVVDNMQESLRFDSNGPTNGATNCEAYDVDLRSSASVGSTNYGIVFEGSAPRGNLISGGTVTSTGSVDMNGVYYGSDNEGRITAGGLNNIIENVSFQGCNLNLAHRTSEPSRNQTVKGCTFSGNGSLFYIDGGHVVESNCKLYNCVVNLPSLKSGSGTLQMSKAAGSFSANGTNTNTNTGSLSTSAYP